MECSTRTKKGTQQQELHQEKIRSLLSNPVVMMRNLTKGSLFHFIQYFWEDYSSETFKSNWHIEYICEELEKLARRVAEQRPKEHDLIINVPPGTSKTATVSIFFPIWCWVNWYWMRFITVSYSASLSLESAEFSRDIIRGDRFKELFPEIQIKEDKDTKTNFRVVKTDPRHLGQVPRLLNGGNRLSTSVLGTVTGFHAHIIIWDDPLNPQQSVSEVELPKVNHWLDRTLSNRKVDKAVTVTIGIMQRLHEDDPTGHMLSKQGKKIKHICLPGEIRNFRDQVQPKTVLKHYRDDLLDPVRLNWDMLKELEIDLGQYGYAGQVGQSPTSPKGGMFKVERFQIIDVYPKNQVVQIVRYWDKAGSDGKGAYTVGAKLARLQNDQIVVLDIKRGQWSSEIRENIIVASAEMDGKDVPVYIEQEPGSGGKESAEATIRRLGIRGFACYADLPTGDKARRADPFSVMVNNGDVALMRADWNKTFIEEHRFFPKSKYKDQVDAASGAYSKLIGRRRVKIG